MKLNFDIINIIANKADYKEYIILQKLCGDEIYLTNETCEKWKKQNATRVCNILKNSTITDISYRVLYEHVKRHAHIQEEGDQLELYENLLFRGCVSMCQAYKNIKDQEYVEFEDYESEYMYSESILELQREEYDDKSKGVKLLACYVFSEIVWNSPDGMYDDTEYLRNLLEEYFNDESILYGFYYDEPYTQRYCDIQSDDESSDDE